nr:NAD(P)-dependent oxidoreductase [Olegusella massiliensis]
MKVLISDYSESMMPEHSLETKTLREGLGEDLVIEVFPYTDETRTDFYKKLSDADALLTAFIPMNEEAFEHAPKLKVIGINATGWDNIDVDAATKRGIGICPIGEYCTWDVSESAIAYLFALNKHLKFYSKQIEENHVWDFAAAPQYPRLQDQTLGIVGFGKIGRCTAAKAHNLVHEIMAYDPYVDEAEFTARGVAQAKTIEELYEKADAIICHMSLNEGNRGFFDAAAFSSMRRKPILINLGRGLSVDEPALVKALDSGQIRAFGADVLYDETPDLAHHPLVGRDNVIITPHAAFYSTSSMRDIQVFSCNNIVNFLLGHKDKLFRLINDVEVPAN